MIELKRDALVFSFPEVHPSAVLSVDFQRTLRIPDDDKDYPLPPGLGRFPVRHVDDYAANVPKSWIEHGGVMLPMYQAEALWLNFGSEDVEDRDTPYPFAVMIATGKVNAVSGGTWRNGIHRRPQQDYVVVPEQPWLDGYCVEKGIIRQFVAMPLGAGYTTEEQITGKAEHGGLQIVAYPMKRDVFERRFPKHQRERVCYSAPMPCCCEAPSSMGLAPGGRMRQEIYDDPYDISDWDLDHGSRCFVHITNSMVWRQVSGENPPTTPPTSKEYTDAGLPWFEWYDDKNNPLAGNEALAGMKSVVQMGTQKGDVPLPENQSVTPQHVTALRKGLRRGQVREFEEQKTRDSQQIYM
ncbi:MAG: hypothetical protein K8T26_11380 [Lentisphaerae bacterium]|nr:hypothetical protein [Lentisphaerota bacterium]